MKAIKHRANDKGFTLIEVVAVLIIIGIVVVIAISRSTSGDSYKVASEVQTLKTYLRFAQSRAMSDEQSWGISMSGTSYTLQTNWATATHFMPDETTCGGGVSATHCMQGGVTITTGAGTTVTFDKWGSPGNTTLSINLSAGGETTPITITRITGFIP